MAKINTFPNELIITSGDKLIGSSETGATRQFPVEDLINVAVQEVNTTNNPGWLSEEGNDTSFIRSTHTDYNVSDSPSKSNISYALHDRINIDDTGFFANSLTAPGTRVSLQNGSTTFFTTIDFVGTDYILLSDAVPEDVLSIFVSGGLNSVTALGNPITTVYGDLNVVGSTNITNTTNNITVDLIAVASPTGVEIKTVLGTDALIPLVSGVNAGLITSSIYDDIVDNTLKVGITPQERVNINNNTAKVGITNEQSISIDDTAALAASTDIIAKDNETQIGLNRVEIAELNIRIDETGEVNVQSDWDELDVNDDSYIKNKPILPEGITDTNTITHLNNSPAGSKIRSSLIPDVTLGKVITFNGNTIEDFLKDWTNGDASNFHVDPTGLSFNTGDILIEDTDATPVPRLYTGVLSVAFGKSGLTANNFVQISFADISSKLDVSQYNQDVANRAASLSDALAFKDDTVDVDNKLSLKVDTAAYNTKQLEQDGFISGNTSNISTNTGDILINTNNISSNDMEIETNRQAIALNTAKEVFSGNYDDLINQPIDRANNNRIDSLSFPDGTFQTTAFVGGGAASLSFYGFRRVDNDIFLDYFGTLDDDTVDPSIYLDSIITTAGLQNTYSITESGDFIQTI